MLTKTAIQERKSAGDSQFFMKTLAPSNDERTLRFVLQNLGRLPSDFNPDTLLSLLKHENAGISPACLLRISAN